jgi:hypothetical protein
MLEARARYECVNVSEANDAGLSIQNVQQEAQQAAKRDTTASMYVTKSGGAVRICKISYGVGKRRLVQ